MLWAAVVLFIGGRETVPDLLATRLPIDKVGHFVMYGVLGWLVGRGWLRVGGGRSVVPVLILMMLGAVDEMQQIGLPTRSASFTDWLADCAGAVVGFTLAVRNATVERRSREA